MPILVICEGLLNPSCRSSKFSLAGALSFFSRLVSKVCCEVLLVSFAPDNLRAYAMKSTPNDWCAGGTL